MVVTMMGSVVQADSASIIDETLLGQPIDAGAFEPGTTLGLEIVGNGADQLFVEHVALLHDDAVISDTAYDPPVAAQLWLGAVQLVGSSGGALAPGEYAIAVFTGSGAFLATFSIVDALRPDGQSSASASTAFTGLALRVYRLISEEDDGSTIEARDGDALMVALRGNATTGFAWSDVTENLVPVLESVSGTDYFSGSASGVGGGGVFLFRYRAFAVGTQVLRFEYARPWEDIPPAESTMFSINVADE
jgi:predicted secreted protein